MRQEFTKRVWTDSEAKEAATREAIELVAQWMLQHGWATGPGDSIDDLLQELVGQAKNAP
jgi:hypothetical protein